MKTITLFILALTASVCFSGCDKIKDAASFDVTVRGVQFEFDAPVEGASQRSAAAVTRAGELTSFSVTRTIKAADISAELEKHGDKISEVKANNSTVTISVNPHGDYTVSDLKISYTGGSAFTVPSYSVGEALTPPAGLDKYLSGLAFKLFVSGQVEVTVTGKTDAPAGTTVTIRYKNDVVATVSPL